MPSYDFREEVVNVCLADLLEQRGLVSVPETIRKSIAKPARQLPDIIVADLMGVRVVIEGRFDIGRTAQESLLKDAKERVEQGIAPVCLALLYPLTLRNAESVPKLKQKIESAQLTVRVISESNDGDWAKGKIDDIADALRRSYELLVTDDIVVSSVGQIEDAIEAASEVFVYSVPIKERFRKTLGIPAETDSPHQEDKG